MDPVIRFAVFVGCLVLASFSVTASVQAAGPDQHQRKLASSMTATAEMVLDAWLTGTVPAHYAEQTVSVMRGKLADWIGQQASSAQASDPDPGTLQAFQRIEPMLDRAQQAIRAADRSAAAHSLEEIKNALTQAGQGAAPRS